MARTESWLRNFSAPAPETKDVLHTRRQHRVRFIKIRARCGNEQIEQNTSSVCIHALLLKPASASTRAPLVTHMSRWKRHDLKLECVFQICL